MRTLILILFFTFLLFDVYSTEIPQLNLQIGKSYKVATTTYSDSSKTHQMLDYEKCIFNITPLTFNAKQNSYKLEIVLDYYKYVFQKKHYTNGWVEEKAYETGFPCKYTSAFTNLNLNKVKMYMEVTKSGKVLSADLSDYNNYRTNEGLQLELYYYDEKTIKWALEDLFFKRPSKQNESQWQGDNVNYTLVDEDANCIQLKAQYKSHKEDREDLLNAIFLDKKTGLIREKKYNYLWTLPSNKQEPTRFLKMNHQKYIPVISKSFTLAQSKDFAPDSINITNTNTVICAEVDSSSFGNMLIYFGTSDRRYQLQSTNHLCIELSLDEKQLFYPVYIIWKSSPTDPLFEVVNFAVFPGDSLFIKKSLVDGKSRFAVSGIGSNEVEWFVKRNDKLTDLQMKSIGTYANKIKSEIIPNKNNLTPDYIISLLNQADYIPYSLTHNSEDFDSIGNKLLTNSLAVEASYYINFTKKYLRNNIIKDIRKATNTIPTKTDRMIGEYELAKLVYNEPVCGYLRYGLASMALHHDWEIADLMCKRFFKEYKGSLLGKRLEHAYELAIKTSIGKNAPDLKLTDVNGKIHRLSDYRGSVVALRFWDMKHVKMQKFNKRSQAALLDQKGIVEMNVVIADEKKYHEFLKSSEIREDEVVLWADPTIVNKEMAIWRENGNRSFVLDKYGTIQWSGFALAGIALGEELLKMPYHPIKKKLGNTKVILAISFGIIALLLIALLGYRLVVKRRLKKELFNKRIVELENRAIRSQMNPHFVFNALNSIQALVNRQELEKANLYLSKFALLLRRILKSSENFLVKLSDEIEMISVYCELEQLRTPFRWKVIVEENVEPEIISIPGMLIQPLVENAILHGITPIEGGGEVGIHFQQINDELEIRVIDSGVGLNHAKKKESNGHSLGLNLIQEKLEILSKQGNMASMKINSLEQGTEVCITIAYK